MTGRAKQIGLPFDWSKVGRLGEFLVAPANEYAVRHIESWADWPVPVTVLTGPPHSGKSILGRHFREISGGRVIDDADRQDDQALFHAWNETVDAHGRLLLISRLPPAQWGIALPDLASRMAAAHHVRIDQPDDQLVRALIEMLLMRTGASFVPNLPEWLSHRIERRYDAIVDAAMLLHRASLSSKHKISVTSAKEILREAGILPIVEKDTGSTPKDGTESGRS